MNYKEYPLNVYETTYKDHFANSIETLSNFTYNGNWAEVLEILNNDKSLVNRCRLPKLNGKAKLYTPLHQATFLKAPTDVFEKLLSLGASKTLKTADGETAYDIAVQKDLYNVLKLIEVPAEIIAKAEEIEKMEKGLHEVINGRVKKLIDKNGQALPQLSFLYEFETFWYPVPEMYGGFRVEEHKDGIQTSSWCRVVGGSGQRHVIYRDGKSELVEEGFV